MWLSPSQIHFTMSNQWGLSSFFFLKAIDSVKLLLFLRGTVTSCNCSPFVTAPKRSRTFLWSRKWLIILALWRRARLTSSTDFDFIRYSLTATVRFLKSTTSQIFFSSHDLHRVDFFHGWGLIRTLFQLGGFIFLTLTSLFCFLLVHSLITNEDGWGFRVQFRFGKFLFYTITSLFCFFIIDRACRLQSCGVF